MGAFDLPPPEGPEYTPCTCDHIEPEHSDALFQHCLKCGCLRYRPKSGSERLVRFTVRPVSAEEECIATERAVKMAAQAEQAAEWWARQNGPRRGDQFETWLKKQRDLCEGHAATWSAVDGLLDEYRLHADTGIPLNEHVCEGKIVGDCACLEADDTDLTEVDVDRMMDAGEPVQIAVTSECTVSLSGRCLREAESGTACDTDAGECVHGGNPAVEARQPGTETNPEAT